jgi:hypothetical protein
MFRLDRSIHAAVAERLHGPPVKPEDDDKEAS